MATEILNNVRVNVAQHGILGIAYGAYGLTLQQVEKIKEYLENKYSNVENHWTSDFLMTKFTGYFLCRN